MGKGGLQIVWKKLKVNVDLGEKSFRLEILTLALTGSVTVRKIWSKHEKGQIMKT